MENMNISLLYAVGGSTIAIIGCMISLFLWLRSEANSDRRDMMNIIREIQQEIKDFHGRLCTIEERNKK